MRKIEDLNVNGLKIYQDDSLYCFTSDAIMLSRFATVKPKDRVADFCSGSGIVGFHLYGLNTEIESVSFFEMQKSLYDLSVCSIELNGLDRKFFAYNKKVQDIGNEFNGKFSLIVCNPPYMEVNCGEKDKVDEIAICRHEVALSLSELVKSASKALKFGGRFAVVHRADRLVDMMCEMRKNNIEPKRLVMVSATENKEPYLFMVEGVLGGKKGLKVLKTIVNNRKTI